MADNENIINIKDLTEIEQVIAGNKFIIETDDETNILDFKNLIFGLENTTFGDTITGNSAEIQRVEAKVDSLSADVDTQIAAVSADVGTTNRFHFDKKSVSGNTIGTTTITFDNDMALSAQASFTVANASVTLGSAPTVAASGWNWFVSGVSFAGNKPQVTITAAGGGATGTVTYNANIFVPY